MNAFDRYDSTAIGVFEAIRKIGSMVLPNVTGVIPGYYYWGFGVTYIIPMFGVVIVGMYVLLSTITKDPNGTGTTSRSIRNLLVHTITNESVKLTAILGITVLTVQGLTSFYPSYLVEAKGLS